MIRIVLFSILFILARSIFAATLVDVKVDCLMSKKCEEFRSMLVQLENGSFTANGLKRALSPYLTDEAIESFSYRVNSGVEGDHLFVSISFYQTVDDLLFEGVDSSLASELTKVVNIKSGDYFQKAKVEAAKKVIAKSLQQRGMNNIEVFTKEESKEDGVDIVFVINSDKKERVATIEVQGVDGDLKNKFGDNFSSMKNKQWDRIEFKRLQDALQRSLFDEGYFFSTVTSDVVKLSQDNVKLVVTVELNKRYHLNFSGNTLFTRQEIKETLLQIIRKQLGRFNDRELIKEVIALYESVGVYDSEVSLVQRSGVTKYNVPFTNLYFKIKEGQKVPIAELLFIGNDQLTTEQIESLYLDSATVVASRGFVDRKYLEQFTTHLKKNYLNRGFIFVSVSEPKVRFTEGKAFIEYEIREGQRCLLTNIVFEGLPEKYHEELLGLLKNKSKEYLDVLELPNDFAKALQYVRDQGYYFAALTNINERSILQYSDDFSEATINLSFSLERKTVLDSIVVTGNKKTSSRVIQREIHLERGDILTPKDVEQIWNKLTALGLFSKVDISPFVTNRDIDDDYYNVNLLVQVSEVDFGLIEIGPGYRTDLGAKLSANYAYNNLGGMNRSMNLRGQVNRKLNQEGLDVKRPAADIPMMEFEAKASYLEPYLFKIPLEISPEISGSRKRYYNFDADIGRFSLGASKNFGEYLGTSLRYQFEDIRQYNASDEIDKGRFRIGGVTGTINLDFRDNQVSPHKGAYFQFSNEYASPELFSMDAHELTIRFTKFTARSKFYVPIRKNWVFATSVAWGYQKNLAGEENYIPSIKVFRLNGVDNVRGYDDSEINILSNGLDVSDVIVNDRAFFTNLKFETRHYMSDSTIMGLFVDGGSVNVDKYQPATMRYSGGVTVKYLTPVGTIDFDYGIKYKKRSTETLGRFHLSIGFF